MDAFIVWVCERKRERVVRGNQGNLEKSSLEATWKEFVLLKDGRTDRRAEWEANGPAVVMTLFFPSSSPTASSSSSSSVPLCVQRNQKAGLARQAFQLWERIDNRMAAPTFNQQMSQRIFQVAFSPSTFFVCCQNDRLSSSSSSWWAQL